MWANSFNRKVLLLLIKKSKRENQVPRRVRKRAGFTLVEVIVVSVIVAVLAAVAIPVYISYVNSTRQASVDQLAQTAAAAANGYFRKTGADPVLSNLNLFFDPDKYDIIPNAAAGTITVTMKGYTGFNKVVPYK